MKLSNSLYAIAMGFALAGSAQAVHRDPDGRGQALIYPYYTVNEGQQTLLSVTNASSAAQVLNVRFLEGYNGRTVMDFRVFLSPFDMWTATVFNQRDAGKPSDGAAIFTRDTSCTAPSFQRATTSLPDGTPYVSFFDIDYAGTSADGGPVDIQRTREGWIEIIALADLAAPLSTAIAHGSNGQLPTGCAEVGALYPGPATSRPTGSLIGAASVINVAKGTILGMRPEALGGFTGRQLLTNLAVHFEGLSAVNDGGADQRATAHVVDASGRQQSLTYGGGFGRPIDAVSAVLMAGRITNEYQTSDAVGAASDWVVNMPTKPYYTDPHHIGSSTNALPPFDEVFSAADGGQSRVLDIGATLFDRELRLDGCMDPCCGWSGCPLSPPFALRAAGAVLSFIQTNTPVMSSQVLGSTTVTNIRPVVGAAGWLELDLDKDGSGHRLPASAEGKVLRGLPVMGFWATNLVNNAVSNGVLSNYSVAVRHATTISCIKDSDGSACD